MIEKLKRIDDTDSYSRVYKDRMPNEHEVMDKLNEIIEVVNRLEGLKEQLDRIELLMKVMQKLKDKSTS